MRKIELKSVVRQRGFTLVEVTISLFVTVIVLLGVLALFDFSNKLSHVQTNISDMQQSLRVAQADAMRLIRMAGRGGLPVGTLPAGWAVAVRNNVADKSHIGGASSPEIVASSDVLTIRGVFAAPIFQINNNNPAAFQLLNAGGVPVSVGEVPVRGKIRIANTTPTGIPQDRAILLDAITRQRPEALLLVSPQTSGIWAVVELDPATSDTSNPAEYVVGFKITNGLHTTEYSQFSSAGAGVFPPQLTTVAFAGILEEHRFYARQEFAVAGDDKTDLTPKLSRARTYPGTDVPWGDDVGNWRLDIADNVFDLQVALAFDTLAGGCTVAASDNCALTETADGENDDWMYNGEAVTNPLVFAASDLLSIRLSTLARTDRRDRTYQAPTLVKVEDHVYGTSGFNTSTERMYRRRVLRTVIDLRNLG
jgi:type II secretory pathway pseudopilin PulG